MKIAVAQPADTIRARHRRIEAELIPVLWENEAAHALLALTAPGATAAAAQYRLALGDTLRITSCRRIRPDMRRRMSPGLAETA